jgi:hypothetical protein
VPSTTLEPLAQLVKTVLDGLTWSQGLKVYAHDPGYAGMDSLPCAVLSVPTIRRTSIDAPEGQLYTNDWFISMPIDLYFDLDDATATSIVAIEYVETLIKGIDAGGLQQADPTLVEDPKIVDAEPVEIVDTKRPMLKYECALELLKIVP